VLREKENQGRLFEAEVLKWVTKKDPLVRLADEIEWGRFVEVFDEHYDDALGRTAVPIRAVVGLLNT
jgi:hypothetical protein